MKMHARKSNDPYQAIHVVPLSPSVVEGTIVQAETKRRVERAQRGCRKFEQWRIWKCSALCLVLFRPCVCPVTLLLVQDICYLMIVMDVLYVMVNCAHRVEATRYVMC